MKIRPLKLPALAFCALFAAAFPAGAHAAAGYPGAAWGGISRGFDGLEGTGTQGWVKQGVKWFSFSGADFLTFAEYSWRLRTKNNTYYDVVGPGLNASLKKGPFEAGLDTSWLRYPERGESVNSSSLYGGWYYSRDIYSWTGGAAAGESSPKALPLSTWGRFNYDLHGEEGTGSQGWVKQGADWFSFGGGWVLNTFAAYNWRLRSRNRTYYDALGPSLGVNISRGGMDLGLEYLWQRFPKLGVSTKTAGIYLKWYYSWDLKK